MSPFALGACPYAGDVSGSTLGDSDQKVAGQIDLQELTCSSAKPRHNVVTMKGKNIPTSTAANHGIRFK
jgi:hypothetical protein